MPILITGSTAAKMMFPDFPREPSDIDCFVLTGGTDTPPPGNGYDTFSHELLDPWLNKRLPSGWPSREVYATPNELYTIKVAHSHWELPNGSWRKHMFDLQWLKARGATLDMDLYRLLVKVWEDVHGAKKMNMQRSKDAFFTDAVVRIYDHDSIHWSVAYGDEPLYVQFLKPGAEVDMDMEKLKAAPRSVQIALFREEVYATALERLLIPNDYRFSPGHAYLWALRRTITSLTRGWSSRFMIENYDRFREVIPGYVNRHHRKKHLLIPLETPTP